MVSKHLKGTLLIATVIVMDLLSGMEFDLFVPSFAQIQAHFGVSAFWLEALLSVNFIGYGVSLIVVGHYADRYGRKPMILSGLLCFVLGSLFCVAGHWYALLLFGRFLQGVGVAGPSILSFLIIADRYAMDRQQFLLAMLNGIMNVAVGVAPVLGSAIALYFQWRGNFFALLVLGVFTAAMVMGFIPKERAPSPSTVGCWAGYKAVWQSKPLLFYIFFFAVMSVPWWLFVGVAPLLYVKNLHVSLRVFGLYQGVVALAFGVGSILFGFLVNHGARQMWLKSTLWVFVLSLFVMGWVTWAHSMDPKMITFAVLVFVVGEIIPSAVLYPLCLTIMPDAKAKLTALMQGVRLLMTSLGLQLAGYFYNGTFRDTGLMICVLIIATIVMQFILLKKHCFVPDRVVGSS